MTLFRRISPWLLLFVSALPLFLSAAFLAGGAVVREVMRERLARERPDTLWLAASDIRWLRAGEEAEVGGRMFDVVSVAQVDGGVLLTGLFDDGETSLQQALQRQDGGGERQRILVRILMPCLGLLSATAPASFTCRPWADADKAWGHVLRAFALCDGHPIRVFQPPPVGRV
jgi:hypothetical protein